MQYATLASLFLAAGANAAAVHRQDPPISVKNFSVKGSWPSEITHYSLDVIYDSVMTDCRWSNSVYGSNPCGDDKNAAELAGPFGPADCTNEVFSWSFEQVTSSSGVEGWGLQIKRDLRNPKIGPIYGCKFIPANYTCEYVGRDPAAPGYATTLNVPADFEMTTQDSPTCQY